MTNNNQGNVKIPSFFVATRRKNGVPDLISLVEIGIGRLVAIAPSGSINLGSHPGHAVGVVRGMFFGLTPPRF